MPTTDNNDPIVQQKATSDMTATNGVKNNWRTFVSLISNRSPTMTRKKPAA
jgi:hypothetical protein